MLNLLYNLFTDLSNALNKLKSTFWTVIILWLMKMSRYSRLERLEMVLLFGACGRSAKATARAYADLFPTSDHPNYNTVLNVINRLRKTGSLERGRGSGAPKRLNDKHSEDVLAYVAAHPDCSIRSISREYNISHTSIGRILHKYGAKHYETQIRLDRPAIDYQHRFDFCNWFLANLDENPEFQSQILWSGQATFTEDGIVNLNKLSNQTEKWSTTVWCGILDKVVIGPFFFSTVQTGERFLRFLDGQFSKVLREMPFKELTRMWFQFEVYNTVLCPDVRQWLNFMFPKRWIGTDGPVIFPQRSTDLTPIGFFMWDYLKQEIYRNRAENVNELQFRIQTACEVLSPKKLKDVQEELVIKMQDCIVADGGDKTD